MEEEGIPVPSMASSPPLTSDDQPDFSPAGSPDLSDHHHPPLAPSSDQPPATLTDELRDKIIKQVEYYFSDENLPTDHHLMKYVSKDKAGFVPIGVIASFRKMKKLTRDISLIASALRASSLLIVSASGKKVKRLQPLEVKDPGLCTVVVENLPDDHSVENLQRIFGEAGKIQNIIIRDPNAAKDSRKLTITEKLLSAKLHALVEYDTVEAAEKAVSSLNNEQDWRYGLRVKLLCKKNKADTKVEARKKVWQEVDEEKNSTVQATNSAEENHCSSDHYDDSHDEEEEHLPKEKTEEHPHKEKNGEQQSQKDNNVHRNRNRRGRRQKYHGTNGHGHGTPPTSHHIEPSKPPPGPKMPDGTRGFAMGRGRPLQPSAS